MHLYLAAYNKMLRKIQNKLKNPTGPRGDMKLTSAQNTSTHGRNLNMLPLFIKKKKLKKRLIPES